MGKRGQEFISGQAWTWLRWLLILGVLMFIMWKLQGQFKPPQINL